MGYVKHSGIPPSFSIMASACPKRYFSACLLLKHGRHFSFGRNFAAGSSRFYQYGNRFSLKCKIPHSQNRVSVHSKLQAYHYSTAKDTDFKAFYYFPYIVPMRMFSRLKLLQTVVTVSVVPAYHIGEHYGMAFYIDQSLTLSLTVLALSMLYAMGEFFRRLIGVMYLNKEQTEVKLSHLTFFGNRRDLVIPVSDVIPLRDSAEDKDVVHKLRRYSTSQFLLFSTKHGRVLDPEMFKIVFGDIQTAGD